MPLQVGTSTSTTGQSLAGRSLGLGSTAGASYPDAVPSTTAFYARRDAPASADPSSTGMSLNNWTKLNSEFQFIAENEEHTDIAAGDRVIDESLINEVLDHLESSTGAPEAETQSSEVIIDSELYKQLVSVKVRLDAEITQSKKEIPLCY
ncbi:hypothetical protein B0H10DRAFT_2207023 [Mycena sp. CBHHK59/15]|nr:hypothetical protein B0H10DRAFT_2207023 [Mycena sp. CBHHK59/15]